MHTPAQWSQVFKGGFWHFPSLDSTQDFLQKQRKITAAMFCRADVQTQGRGQRARPWESPRGQLYCSLRWFFPHPPALCAGLTQNLALAVVETLDPQAEQLKLKWPNDLLSREGKCGGILCESEPLGEGTLVTVGMGLNLVPHPPYGALPPPPRTPSALLDQIMPPLIARLQHWEARPWLPLNHRWRDYDAYDRREARLINRPEAMTLLGIDQRGALIARGRQGLVVLTQTRIQS